MGQRWQRMEDFYMDELHKMHAFINDFWQFIKTHFDARDQGDEYWQEVVTKVSAMCKKYDNHPAVVQTILGYIDYLEHEGSGRERRKIQ